MVCLVTQSIFNQNLSNDQILIRSEMALSSKEVGKIFWIIFLDLILLNPWLSPAFTFMSYTFEINEKSMAFKVTMILGGNLMLFLSLIFWMNNMKNSPINNSFSATVCLLFTILVNLFITEPIRVLVVYGISKYRYRIKKINNEWYQFLISAELTNLIHMHFMLKQAEAIVEKRSPSELDIEYEKSISVKLDEEMVQACDELMAKVKELRGSQHDSSSSMTQSIEEIDEKVRARRAIASMSRQVNLSLGSEDVHGIAFENP